MSANRPFGAVAELAAAQYGVFTRAQAAAHGIDRHRLRRMALSGLLEPLGNGVFAVAGSPDGWERQLIAATLHPARPAASHRSAGVLHGLDGIEDRWLEVQIERHRTVELPGFVVHRTTRWEKRDLVLVRGIRCTSLARTLNDLGMVVDDEIVERATDDALRRGISRKHLDAQLERLRRPGPSGTGRLDRVLSSPDRLGTLPENWFERQVVRAVVAAGFPLPVLQHRVPLTGGRSYRLDGAYPELLIGIEADGDGVHGRSVFRRRDRRREQVLVALGWEIVHAGWEDRSGSRDFIAALRAVYDRRSRDATA